MLPETNHCSITDWVNSSDSREMMIRDLNDQRLQLYLPVITSISVAMFMGIMGNTLVCYVYSCKMEKTGINIFVVMLGVCDLLTCLFSMPMEIYRLTRPRTFQGHHACKLALSFAFAIVILSGMTIFAISIERYRRMNRPFEKQMARDVFRLILVVLPLLSVVFAWPSWKIYGTRRVPTKTAEFEGCECGFDEALFKTIYPRLFYYLLLSLSVGIFTVIFALYLLIAAKVLRHQRARTERTIPLAATSNPPGPDSDLSSGTARSTNPVKASGAMPPRETPRPKPRSNSLTNVSRSSSIMALIAVSWVVSYLPHVTLVIIEIHERDFRKNLGTTADVLFQLGIRSYLFSSAVNPIIYGALNLRFRKEIVRGLSWLCFRGRNGNGGRHQGKQSGLQSAAVSGLSSCCSV